MLTTGLSAPRSADVLDKVVEYFLYWYKNVDKPNVPDMDIPPEICLQLLQAADFLGLDSKPPFRLRKEPQRAITPPT
jgi:hypothetical protein